MVHEYCVIQIAGPTRNTMAQTLLATLTFGTGGNARPQLGEG
jgi:hypothetical protein